MTTNVFYELAKYYQAATEQLNSEAKQAKILSNTTAIGTDKEEIYRRFLERHLPKNCDVFRGGYVFDINGNASKQIDVIVTAGPTPRFEMGSGKQAIAPIEGTVAVIEVKSKLNKKELTKTLDLFSSLPRIEENSQQLNPQIKLPKYWKWDFPYKVLFAYDGIKKDKLCAYILEYYKENPDIPQECRPSVIQVLGQYAIFRMLPDMIILEPDGKKAEQQPLSGTYRWFNKQSDLLAMAFMFSHVRNNAFLTNHMIVRGYDKSYINQIADVILRCL